MDLLLDASIHSRDIHMALSGGSTPGILFKYLSEISSTAAKGIWDRVFIYWVDERCVPPDNRESNYRMANEILLKNIPVFAGNVFRMNGENKPEEEAYRYSQVLINQLPEQEGLPVFDLILLGMGADGHTASIFPDRMDLLASEKICDVGYHPETNQARITLTGPVINNASKIYFMITGADKAETLKSIIGQDSQDPGYPVSHIEPLHGSLTWFLDESAASLL